MTKIYTRTGDKGETSLYTGQRIPKNSHHMEALGTIDECNSTVGMVVALLPEGAVGFILREQLELIQHSLFDLGASVATPLGQASEQKKEKTRFGDEAVHELEQWMDKMEENLPPLKTFILPGGHPAGASLHLARTVCRSAERQIVPLHQSGAVADEPLAYLNRLSDYFFMAARYLNHAVGAPETAWVHREL